MKAIKVFSLFLFLISASFSAQQSVQSYEEAQTLAMKENKKIVVELYTDWCSYCKRFDAKTLSNEEVQTKLQDYILLRLNPEKSTDAFAKKNDEKSYPKLMIVDEKGNVVRQDKGYMNSKNFLQFLDLRNN